MASKKKTANEDLTVTKDILEEEHKPEVKEKRSQGNQNKKETESGQGNRRKC